MSTQALLTTRDHRRDRLGLTYVYPVLSRRAGGLSIGINLNPNNACNWYCCYCQVPNLKRGSAPVIDRAQLADELLVTLQQLASGELASRLRLTNSQAVPRDIAIAGNGEPTTVADFAGIVGDIIDIKTAAGLTRLKLTLITNGSRIHVRDILDGLRRIAAANGEIWFKLDTVIPEQMKRINGVSLSLTSVRKRLETAAYCCPTWLQTCLFAVDGNPPDQHDCDRYLAFIEDCLNDGLPLQGVQLYGLARPSLQPGGEKLSRLPQAWLRGFAARIRKLGLAAHVFE